MYPPLVQALVVSTKAGREATVYSAMFMGSWTIPHGEAILAELITSNNLSEPECCTIIVLSSMGDGQAILMTGNKLDVN